MALYCRPFNPAIELTGWECKVWMTYSAGVPPTVVLLCLCFYFKSRQYARKGIGHTYGFLCLLFELFHDIFSRSASCSRCSAVAPITFPASGA